MEFGSSWARRPIAVTTRGVCLEASLCLKSRWSMYLTDTRSPGLTLRSPTVGLEFETILVAAVLLSSLCERLPETENAADRVVRAGRPRHLSQFDEAVQQVQNHVH